MLCVLYVKDRGGVNILVAGQGKYPIYILPLVVFERNV